MEIKYKNLLLYTVLLSVGSIITASRNNPNSNRVYFNIDPEDRKIVIPVQFNDSVTGNMVFDSGWYNSSIFIDFGMPQDFVIMHPNKKESDYFSKKENAVWTTNNSHGYKNSYSVTATLFDKFQVDSLRIYFFDEPTQKRMGSDYLIGLNFLKRFNVFFDMKNKQIGFQPIKNFQRIVNPTHRRFYISKHETGDGKFIVDIVADYKENPYKKAGIQKGDEIISYNGFLIKNITEKEQIELDKQDTLTIGIMRNNQPMQLIVPRGKVIVGD